jgi:hypothetical protein
LAGVLVLATLSIAIGVGTASIVGLSQAHGAPAGADTPAVTTSSTTASTTTTTSAPTTTTTTTPPPPPKPTFNNSSYAIVDAKGGVMTFGGAGYEGDTLGTTLNKPIVGGAPDPNGGYWLVATDGGIFTFGGAQFYGSTGGITLNKPIVGMAATPDGDGYWLVASDGGIFAFGDANFFGSTGSLHLNKPIVGMASSASGNGYWLVASDGGIFAFGDANFFGSTGAITLNKPIVGMAALPNGLGYWLVAADGGIFTFGEANFFGSTGALNLNAPIVGMQATPDGEGYWLVGSDAGVFTFGDAQFAGSAQSPLHPPLFPAGFSQPIAPVVAIISDIAGDQATHQGELRVTFAGDSIGFYEGEYTLGLNPPYLIDNGAAPGCGFTNGATLIPYSNPNSIYTDPDACAIWAQQLEWVTARFHPDVTVIQVGYWEAQKRLYQGTYQTLADPAYADYIQANLEQAVQIAHSYGGAVILANSPYFADGTPANLVMEFNNIVTDVVSADASYVTLINVNQLFDPAGVYQATVNGILARTPDGVHVTESGVQVLLDPTLNPLINKVGGPVYQGNA